MEDVQKYLGFAIGFILIILFLSMAFGDKVSDGFLILILMGMLLYNIDVIQGALTKLFTL